MEHLRKGERNCLPSLRHRFVQAGDRMGALSEFSERRPVKLCDSRYFHDDVILGRRRRIPSSVERIPSPVNNGPSAFPSQIDRCVKRMSSAKKIHIEIDPAEINKNVRVDVGLIGDLKEILETLLPRFRVAMALHGCMQFPP